MIMQTKMNEYHMTNRFKVQRAHILSTHVCYKVSRKIKDVFDHLFF